MSYAIPAPIARPAAAPKTAYLITSGDLRESANIAGWPVQQATEAAIGTFFGRVLSTDEIVAELEG